MFLSRSIIFTFTLMALSTATTVNDINKELTKYKNLAEDPNGYLSHDVDMKTDDGGFMKVHFRGRYVKNNHFHNMDNDKSIKHITCDRDSVHITYKSAHEAQQFAMKTTNSMKKESGNKKSLLTGKMLWQCPPATPPKNGPNPKHTNHFGGGVRQIMGVSVNPKNPKLVHLKTSYAGIMDVFTDLEYSGETNLFARSQRKDLSGEKLEVHEVANDETAQTKFQKYAQWSKPEIRTVIAKEDELKGPFVVAPDRCRLRICRAFQKLGQKIKSAFQKAFGAVKNFFHKTFSPCRRGNVGQCAISIFQGFMTVLKFPWSVIGRILPPLLDVSVTHSVGNININYNVAGGHAQDRLLYDKGGSLMRGMFVDFQKITPAQGGTQAAAGLLTNVLTCGNCFVAFTNGHLTWSLRIGGGSLISVGLTGDFDYEIFVELISTIAVSAEIMIPLPAPPSPFGINLGKFSIGFTFEPMLAFGVTLSTTGLYYQWNDRGHLTAGFRTNWPSTPSFTGRANRFGGYPKTMGPIIAKGASLDLFFMPGFALVFTDVAMVTAGLEPTLSFTFVRQTSSCPLEFSISFDLPLVLGAYIGLMTPKGHFAMAGITYSVSLLPAPINLLSRCIGRNFISNIYGFLGVPSPVLLEEFDAITNKKSEQKLLGYTDDTEVDGGASKIVDKPKIVVDDELKTWDKEHTVRILYIVVGFLIIGGLVVAFVYASSKQEPRKRSRIPEYGTTWQDVQIASM